MKLRPTSAAGFTLLEIILAVGIGVIFMGGAVVLLSTTGGDQDLVQARRMLEEAAGEARQRALETGQSQTVRLDADAVEGKRFPGDVEMELITPEDLMLGRRDWSRPKDVFWTIHGGGLVTPIRVQLRHGDNREVFEFNALTGEAVTQRAEAP